MGNCWLCVVELANEQRDAKACQTPVRAQRLDAVVDVRLVRLGERHPTEQVHVTMDGERSAPEQLESICRLSRN